MAAALATPSDPPRFLTYAYKHVASRPIFLDVYPPSHNVHPGEQLQGNVSANHDQTGSQHTHAVPAVIYFHGGGLAVGSRRSWFPAWLQRRVAAAGYAFISIDYRLLPPATGHDILADIKDVFTFVSRDLNTLLEREYAARDTDSEDYSLDGRPFRINPEALGVAGTSAGGLCAYLSAIHASPKPKVLVGMYPLGGDFLTSHYLSPKHTPFFRGRDLLDVSLFSDYLYPSSGSLQMISDSPLDYYSDSHSEPGYPANPRMLLSRLYLQLGVYLDYYTGEHAPSISKTLRDALDSFGPEPPDDVHERLRQLIPERHHVLFPQFNITGDWPPTIIAHGLLDTAVPVQDSQNIQTLLERAGVQAHCTIIDGQEHSFDYDPSAEEKYGAGFNMVEEFVISNLGVASLRN